MAFRGGKRPETRFQPGFFFLWTRNGSVESYQENLEGGCFLGVFDPYFFWRWWKSEIVIIDQFGSKDPCFGLECFFCWHWSFLGGCGFETEGILVMTLIYLEGTSVASFLSEKFSASNSLSSMPLLWFFLREDDYSSEQWIKACRCLGYMGDHTNQVCWDFNKQL